MRTENPGPSGSDSDEALMERFCTGDSRAFEALFSRYAAPVRGYLHRISGSQAMAEDLLQMTFLSVVRGRGRFLHGNLFKPWLYAIATNAARDQLRRKRPEELTLEGELPRDAAAEPVLMKDAGLEKAVRDALAQLPANQREVILLHRFEGLSMAEIAETLGAGESAVKVRAHRGYEKLRVLLKGVWEEDR